MSDHMSDQASDHMSDQASDQASDQTSDQASDQTSGQASDQTSSETPERREIERLLRAKGLRRFELFLTQREGIELPGGLEAMSGFVVGDDKHVHGFWLSWDSRRGRTTLDPWYLVRSPVREFGDQPEFFIAMRRLVARTLEP